MKKRTILYSVLVLVGLICSASKCNKVNHEPYYALYVQNETKIPLDSLVVGVFSHAGTYSWTVYDLTSNNEIIITTDRDLDFGFLIKAKEIVWAETRIRLRQIPATVKACRIDFIIKPDTTLVIQDAEIF